MYRAINIESANRLIHPFQRLPTHSGAEAGKEVALPVLHSSGVKAEAQKVKSGIGVFPPPLVVLTVLESTEFSAILTQSDAGRNSR